MSYPGTVIIPIYQVSRFAQEQPFDMILFRPTFWPRLVEVRSNQWGVAKASTRQLARLPGEGYFKQIWRFQDGHDLPNIRQWEEDGWQGREEPWGRDLVTWPTEQEIRR